MIEMKSDAAALDWRHRRCPTKIVKLRLKLTNKIRK